MTTATAWAKPVSMFPLGFARLRMESAESSLKYFLLGAFASGFLLYGIALILGTTGTTRLDAIAHAIQGMPGVPGALQIGPISWHAYVSETTYSKAAQASNPNTAS